MDEKRPAEGPTARDVTVLDVEELLGRCMGNIQLAERVVAKFLQGFGAEVAQIEEGLAAEDAEQVVRLAHRLKGTAANVSALGLREQMAEIEMLGRQQRISEIPARLERLRSEWVRFEEAASSFSPSPGGP